MYRHSKRKRIWITIIIFFIIFLLRVPNITNSPAEYGEYWRQPDTESIARNFIEKKFNIFYPQFNYDGAAPNYVQLELQITTFIIAILYKIFGYSNFIARLVPTLFFMGSVYYIYLIVKKLYSLKQALITIVIYGILPINLYYSRAIMPESALLFFFTGAFYYFISWLEKENFWILLLSGIFTALAISQKIPAVFIGLAMIAMCFTKYKFKFLYRKDLWLFLIISIVPNIIYFLWAATIAEAKFVSLLASNHIFPEFYKAIFTQEALDFYKNYLIESFGLIPLICAFIGFFSVLIKKESPILFWSIAIILEIIFIVSVILLKYYLIILSPIIAILSGKTISYFWIKHNKGLIISFCLAAIIYFDANILVKNSFNEVDWIIESSKILNQHTKKDDLIVIGTFDPAILSLSNRNGWRANIKYYDYIPNTTNDEMAYFINNGAKYFFVYDNFIYDDDGSYIEFLNKNFKKKYNENKYVLYELQ